MPAHWKELLRKLKRLCLTVKHRAEQAEAEILPLNAMLKSVGESGLMAETVILGPIVLEPHYPPVPGGHTSGRLVQAALRVPEGLGAAVWDTEEYAELVAIDDGLQAEIGMAFIPFESLPPAWKAAVLPHADALLAEFWKRFQEQSGRSFGSDANDRVHNPG